MKNIFVKKGSSPLGRDLFGLHFPHPFGSGPGADPMAMKYNSFLHSAFVEIGPLTSVVEPETVPARFLAKVNANAKELLGIKKPAGELMPVKEAIVHIQTWKPRCMIAANLAPSRTSIDGESITRDIATSFNYMYDFADMFIIDAFRKNADGTVPLQNVELLSEVMDTLLSMRSSYDVIKPIFIRVESTVQEQNLAAMLDYMRYSSVDAIIAGYDSDPAELVQRIVTLTQGRYPVIACGAVSDAEKAQELLDAGACLVQLSDNFRTILKTIEKNAKTI